MVAFLASLILVNLSDMHLKGIAVPLPARRLYRMLGADFGKPLNFEGPEGRVIPCQFDRGREAVWVLVDLPPGGRKEVRVFPSSKWSRVSRARAYWDPMAKRGELTNGLVILRLDGRTASLLLLDGKPIIEGLHFYGWLTDKPIRVPSPRWAAEKGIPRLATSEFESLEVEVKEGPVRAEISFVKRAKVEGIVYRERFVLHPSSPVVEYWLEVGNERGAKVYIADCDAIIGARWGEGMRGRKVLELPTRVRKPILGPWFCVGKGDFPPEERTWVVVHREGGPSLGIVNLTKHTHNWCFPGSGFCLYQAGPKGERPIPIPPKGKVTFGVAFALFPDERTGFEGTKALFHGKGVFAGPPVSAFLGGKPLLGASVLCLKEGFRWPGRWLVRGGRLERGGGFFCEEERAVATLPLEVKGKRPLKLRVEVEELKGRMTVGLRPVEGGRAFLFEVREPGRHDWDVDISGEVVLQIGLEGKGSEARLRRLYLGPRPLPAPKLLSPIPNAEITDIASFFVWRFVEGAEGYEVQFSREPDFKRPLTFKAPELGANVAVFFPERPLEEGRWFFRVRGVGEGGAEGEWSEARSFVVRKEHPRRPLLRPLGRERPLFILHSPSEIDKAWATIPNDLKPYCALRVEVAERGLDLFQFCRLAERSGAKVIIQCSGPGGGVYGEVYRRPGRRGQYGRQSLADLEWAFRNCPNVIGAIIVEQFFHHFSDPTSREYARRLLMLCAKYGRLFVWADAHWYEGLTWLRLGAEHPEMLELFREYKPYVAVLHKMNCWREPLLIHGSVFGLWTCGFVGNFGVEPEDWYWFEAGFGKLGESLGRGKGNRELMPPTFWGQMMLIGLGSGGTCWCLEPCWGLWEPPDIKPRWSLRKVVFPLMRAIVKRRLIPSREEVLSTVKAACKVEPRDLRPYKEGESFGPFEVLYRGTYGLRHPSELIPDNGRYYFIPLLPVPCRRPPRGLRLFKMSEFKNPDEVRKFFDSLYPRFYEGDAFVARVGSLILAMNSRENEDVTQSFRLPLEAGVVRALGAELGPHSYIVAKVEGRGLFLHVNGRVERKTILRLECSREPSLKVSPEEGLMERRWERGTLTLVISHRLGAVEIEVNAGGRM